MRKPPTEIWVTTPHIDRPAEDQVKEPEPTQLVGCVHCDPMLPPPKQVFFVKGTSVCKEHKNV